MNTEKPELTSIYNQKEIGGYFELDNFAGKRYHDKAIPLHCGRAGLAYLIEAKQIKTLWVPDFLCASIDEVCADMNVEVKLYPIDINFLPALTLNDIPESDHFYLVNYYGQLSNTYAQDAANILTDRLIVDNVMAYFEIPLETIDTIYSCRKFFGVADGGELYTTATLDRDLMQDNSHDAMDFVLGRFECPAGEFFSKASANNSRFTHQGARKMSPITENILRALPYEEIKAKREANFSRIHELLRHLNLLELHAVPGPFMYPLLVENGDALRAELQARKIFAPKLWPYCQDRPGLASYLAHNIVPVPIDQRYDLEDMDYIAKAILDIQ